MKTIGEVIEYIEDMSRALTKVEKSTRVEDPVTSGDYIARKYELGKLKRFILEGELTDNDLEGWLLIYAGSYTPVDEYLVGVERQTGLDRARVAKAMWDLIEEGRLEYTSDAKVKAA